MKLTCHKDGYWSLTGMAAEDVRKLSSGLYSDAAQNCEMATGRRAYPGMTETARAFHALASMEDDAFDRVLRAASEYGGRGLKRGTSITFTRPRASYPSDADAPSILARFHAGTLTID